MATKFIKQEVQEKSYNKIRGKSSDEAEKIQESLYNKLINRLRSSATITISDEFPFQLVENEIRKDKELYDINEIVVASVGDIKIKYGDMKKPSRLELDGLINIAIGYLEAKKLKLEDIVDTNDKEIHNSSVWSEKKDLCDKYIKTISDKYSNLEEMAKALVKDDRLCYEIGGESNIWAYYFSYLKNGYNVEEHGSIIDVLHHEKYALSQDGSCRDTPIILLQLVFTKDFKIVQEKPLIYNLDSKLPLRIIVEVKSELPEGLLPNVLNYSGESWTKERVRIKGNNIMIGKEMTRRLENNKRRSEWYKDYKIVSIIEHLPYIEGLSNLDISVEGIGYKDRADKDNELYDFNWKFENKNDKWVPKEGIQYKTIEYNPSFIKYGFEELVMSMYRLKNDLGYAYEGTLDIENHGFSQIFVMAPEIKDQNDKDIPLATDWEGKNDFKPFYVKPYGFYNKRMGVSA